MIMARFQKLQSQMTFKGLTQLITNMAKGQNRRLKTRGSKKLVRAYLSKKIDIQYSRTDLSIPKVELTTQAGRVGSWSAHRCSGLTR